MRAADEVPKADVDHRLHVVTQQVRELEKAQQITMGRLDMLENEQRRQRDRHDEVVDAINKLGDRIRGTHGVATDAIAGINAMRKSLDHTGKLVDAIHTTVRLLARGVARPRRTTR